jgi:hypothetical protein
MVAPPPLAAARRAPFSAAATAAAADGDGAFVTVADLWRRWGLRGELSLRGG